MDTSIDVMMTQVQPLTESSLIYIWCSSASTHNVSTNSYMLLLWCSASQSYSGILAPIFLLFLTILCCLCETKPEKYPSQAPFMDWYNLYMQDFPLLSQYRKTSVISQILLGVFICYKRPFNPQNAALASNSPGLHSSFMPDTLPYIGHDAFMNISMHHDDLGQCIKALCGS